MGMPRNGGGWRAGKVFLCGFFVLLLASSSLSARDVRGPKPSLSSSRQAWNRIRSAHFIIFSDAPEAEARRIVANLETFRSALSTFHGRLVIDPPRPTYLFLFKSEKDFRPYKPRIKAWKLVAGYMNYERDANYLAGEIIKGSDASPIIYHEFVHQFLTENLPNAPLWFNEGIADFYSTFEAHENGIKIGLPIDVHVQYLRSHPMMPLEDLFKVDHEAFERSEGDRLRTFYAESWAVIHYLLGDEKHRSQVASFLDNLQKGEPPDHAYAISFDADYDALRGQVSNYLNTGRFRFGTVDRSEIRDANTHARVERMAEDEVLARLGDLLIRSDSERGEEAERYFRKALRVNPKCAAAEAGLGFLAALKQRFPEAIAHYDSAIALDSYEFDYPYLAAMSWLGESPHPPESASRRPRPSRANVAKARELLRKTIQLSPGFAEAYVSLGKTYLIEDDGAKEGIALLLKAQKLLPRRMDVAAGLVRLYLKVGDRTSAGEVAERVLAPSGDSEEIEVARSALEDYDRAHGSASPGAPDSDK